MSAYSTAVLADSPVAYWRLGDASGNIADSSGNSHTGTANGTPTYGQASLIPQDTANLAMGLNGTTAFFSGANTPELNAGDVTIEFWMTPTGTLNSTQRVVVQCGDTSGHGIDVDHASAALNMTTRGLIAYTCTGLTLVSGTTYYVVCVYHKQTSVDFYINGSFFVTSSSATAAPSTMLGSTVGAFVGGGSPFLGVLDELAIYTGALSAARITAHYNAATQSGPPSPTGSALPRTRSRQKVF